MAKVTMPQLGESVAEGTIGRWLKKPGDAVAKYEPLLEVITDKVNAEVPSPVAGVLKEILVQEGATVPNNAEIAIIEEAGEAASANVAPTATEKQAAPSEADRGGAHVEPREAAGAAAHGPAGSDERGPGELGDRAAASASIAVSAGDLPASGANGTVRPMPGGATGNGAESGTAPAGDADARMTPAVRRLLREHGLAATQIVGTGGGGRITREDVLNTVEASRTGQAVGAQQPRRATRAARRAGRRQRLPPQQATARPHGRPLRGTASSSRTAQTRSSSRPARCGRESPRR